jgi:hypothetical protein
MLRRLEISSDIAARVGAALGIDWTTIDPNEFRLGLELEIEREWRSPDTNPSYHDLECTGKVVLTHIEYSADHYTRLERLAAGDGACEALHLHAVRRERFQYAGSQN